jgi:hypothetical protein
MYRRRSLRALTIVRPLPDQLASSPRPRAQTTRLVRPLSGQCAASTGAPQPVDNGLASALLHVLQTLGVAPPRAEAAVTAMQTLMAVASAVASVQELGDQVWQHSWGAHRSGATHRRRHNSWYSHEPEGSGVRPAHAMTTVL